MAPTMIRALLPALASLLVASPGLGAGSTINPADKFAYGANVGWINLEGNGTDGVVVGEAFLSGSAYGANVGWINFGDGTPANGYSYANDSGTDFGVNNDRVGNLSGYAYGANIGWINFGWAAPGDPARPRVDLLTGAFGGFAYGANVGWINLGAGYLVTDTLFDADADHDGIADWWEHLHFGDTETADATSNFDKDRATDLDEYHGGSDPRDPADFFRVTSHSAAPTTLPLHEATLEFTSSEGRLYRILMSDSLRDFVDSGLGTFSPDPGTSTTKTLQVSGSIKFFRVLAIKPLQ